MTEETQQSPEPEVREAGQQTPPIESPDESQAQVGGASADAAPPLPAKSAGVNRIYAFGLAAAVLGIVAGIAFATIALRKPGRTGTYDMGSAIFLADGLKGHLVLNWNKQLAYRLVVEPSDPAQSGAFSLAVSTPPRPLAVGFQLKDSAGYVLCFKSIVVKFDPRQAARIAASGSGSQAGGSSSDQAWQAAEMARQDARELERENGQDIFHLDAGQNGQSNSITAQGEIPCPAQAYQHVASWGFSPDFPTLDEQADWLKQGSDLRAEASPSTAQTAGALGSSARQRKTKKGVAEATTAFAIEGDDELVGFDPARGIVKTSTGETFVVVKAAAADNAARWQDLPATIHFKCNLNSVCALTRRDADVLYARLKR